MTFIAMNRFKINLGHEAAFEDIWRNREGRLKDVPGFIEFRLLKGPVADDHVLYSSHVIWESAEAFEGWTKSEAFRMAHKNAGQNREVFAGPPQLELFDTVLQEA